MATTVRAYTYFDLVEVSNTLEELMQNVGITTYDEGVEYIRQYTEEELARFNAEFFMVFNGKEWELLDESQFTERVSNLIDWDNTLSLQNRSRLRL